MGHPIVLTKPNFMKIDKNIGARVTIYTNEGHMVGNVFDFFDSLERVKTWVRWYIREISPKVVSVLITQDGGYSKRINVRK